MIKMACGWIFRVLGFYGVGGLGSLGFGGIRVLRFRAEGDRGLAGLGLL